MPKLNEAAIEALTMERLAGLGYTCHFGPDIAPDGPTPLRSSLESPLLESVLQEAVDRLNPDIPAAARQEAVRMVLRVSGPDLIGANEAFHRLLTRGVQVGYRKDGAERGARVWLVDFHTPENNHFAAVNQFSFVENNVKKRPDVVLFVNGLPLVIIELKNAASESATLLTAFQQLQTYKAAIPALMSYNGLLVISDGLEARAGSLSAGYARFSAWKSEDGKTMAPRHKSQLEVLAAGMLNKGTLLDLLRFFTVFEKEKTEDAQGLVSVVTVKKIAAYHQYYAVNKAVASTLEAARRTDEGRGKGGVVWHTQGSGKSLSMVFFTAKIVDRMDNPTIVVLTDRNDLDDQLFDTFAGCAQLLAQEPKQAATRLDLAALLKVASGGIVFSTMQKFLPEKGNVHELLSARRNIVVITDEAHRTQYSFQAREIDARDREGRVVGKKTVYGLAKYLRDALPNATYLGFTGTPVEKKDANTRAIFGDYIDIYDIARAVEDRATVPIYYESRMAKIDLPEEGRRLIRELDEALEEEDAEQAEKAKSRRARLEALIGSESRLATIARDMVEHFEAREAVLAGKGLIVCMSRPIAAALYRHMVSLRPEWHDDDLEKGALKVVMTAGSADGPELSRFHTTKGQRQKLAARMKDPADPLRLVIVCDMWLTGFDVPCLHTMYLDKPMRGHTLMQAIARVNRVNGDKPGGLVVDYLGIAADLKKALAYYSEAGGEGEPALTQEQAVDVLLEKLEVTRALLHGFTYAEYFTAGIDRKLALILEAEEFLLGREDGKKRFLDAVTALASAAALASPHPQARAVGEEVAFFKALKARLAKFDGGGDGGGSVAMETTIKQVIDKALVSEKVVDIFDAAGIKKPDISILSDEFLLEVKNLPHKNIALEVLRKLLNDELRARSRRNLLQSRKLLDLLDGALKRYHNKIITTAEVIDEIISIGKQVRESDMEAGQLGLTEYEYAFYLAVADNDSARDLMGKDKLRELAVVLTERVRANASIDWNIKESVRAQLRVIIKRTLRRYGYPPDMEALATETVMRQAEMLADELCAAA